MEQELTGLFTGDFHKLRIYQNDAMGDILDIISSPGGVPTIVQGGSGIQETRSATSTSWSLTLPQGRKGMRDPTGLCRLCT